MTTQVVLLNLAHAWPVQSYLKKESWRLKVMKRLLFPFHWLGLLPVRVYSQRSIRSAHPSSLCTPDTAKYSIAYHNAVGTTGPLFSA